MSAALGWALAALALAVGWLQYGWQGLVLALSVIVFWLLLQFSRTLRLLRTAAGRPIGEVASAVMLHSRLKTGMRLADVIRLTRSLGRRLREEPETYVWRDAGGDEVQIEFAAGRCSGWQLRRGGGGAP